MNQSAWLNAAILRTTAEWSRQDVKKRQKKGKERARERERADGTITKLKEEADGKRGDGGGGFDVISMVIYSRFSTTEENTTEYLSTGV